MRAVSFSTKCLSFFVAFSLIFNIIYTPPLLSTAINTRSSVIQPTYNDLPSIDDEIAYRKLLRSAQESFGFEDVLDLIDRIEEGHLETLSHKQLLQIGKTLIHFAKLGTKKEDYYAHAVLNQEAVELSHNFSTNSLYYCCAPQLVEYQVIPAMGNYAYEYMLCKSKAFSKFKKFVKKHKKPIIIGAAVVVFVTIVVCTGGTGTAAAGIAGAAGAAGAGIDSSQKKSNSNHTNRPDVISKAQRSPEKANETSIASKQEDEIHESIRNFKKFKPKNEPNKSFVLNDSQIAKLDKEHQRLTQDTYHTVQYPHLEKTTSHPNAPPYNPLSNNPHQNSSHTYSQLEKEQLAETTQNLLLEDPHIQEASPNDHTFLQKIADAGSRVSHALADEIIREAAIPMAQGIDETYDLMERFRDKTYISTRENRASDNVEKISDQIHSAIDSAFKTNYKEIYPTHYQKNHQDTFTHGTLPPPSNWGLLFKGKNLSQGWKPGQPVFNRMKDGTLPSPEIVKSRYWKNQAQNNPNKYSPNNLKRLQQGQPPQRHLKNTGETFTKDLKPVPTGKNDGSYTLKEVWPERRNVTLYRSVNETTGEVQYVGITNNFKRRAAEHLRRKGIEIERIKGLSNLTRSEARCAEQTLIEIHKLEKEGGTLINKINSIGKTQPEYADSLKKGYKVLKDKGIIE